MFFRFLTFLLVLTPLLLSGQDSNTKAYSLKAAQDQAIQNNVQMKLAALDLQISKKTVQNVTAMGLPQIGATGSFNHFIDIPTSVVPADAFGFPDWFNQWVNDVAQTTSIDPNYPAASGSEFTELQFGSKYNSTVGISVNQLIFDGSYIIGLRAAKSFVQVQEQALSKTEIEVKAMVTQAYYSVLIADENVKILESNLNSITETFEDSKVLFSNGFIEQIALDQIKLLTSNLGIRHKTAGEQLEISKKLLYFQMGLPLNSTISLSDDLDALATISNADTSGIKFIHESHIDFQMAQTQVKLMELNKKKEQFTYLPTLGGFFNHQQNAFNNDLSLLGSSWYPTTLWGLSLNVPIWGGFGKAAKVKIAGYELEKAQLQQSQVADGLLLKEASARVSYTSALSIYLNQKDNLALAETIRTKMGIKFKEGLASSMELSQAENQFFSTQSAYIQSVFSLLNANIELQKALGEF